MNPRRLLSISLPPLVPLVLVLVVWETSVRMEWVRSFLVPAPSSIYEAIRKDWSNDLARAIGLTTYASVVGFAFSALIGVTVAVLLSSADWVQRAFYPYAVFFQTVPIVAIAPLLLIWVGDEYTAVTSAFIVSIFPVIANTLTGLQSTDPALRDLFRLYGASRTATLFKLRLPFAMPNILTGFRIAAGLAVIGAVVGEFIAGKGIGDVILVSRQQQKVEKVFAVVLLASLLGIVLFTLIGLISRLTLRHWHASEQTNEQ